MVGTRPLSPFPSLGSRRCRHATRRGCAAGVCARTHAGNLGISFLVELGSYNHHCMGAEVEWMPPLLPAYPLVPCTPANLTIPGKFENRMRRTAHTVQGSPIVMTVKVADRWTLPASISMTWCNSTCTLLTHFCANPGHLGLRAGQNRLRWNYSNCLGTRLPSDDTCNKQATKKHGIGRRLLEDRCT